LEPDDLDPRETVLPLEELFDEEPLFWSDL
jgi:hypothetical protein